MNTQELAPKTAVQVNENKQSQDPFAQSLTLWIASFPLFAVGLALSGGNLHALGMLLQLSAAVCFFSPATLLLGCLGDRE